MIDGRSMDQNLVKATFHLRDAWLACRDPDTAAWIATARNYLCKAQIMSGERRERMIDRAFEALRMGQRAGR